MPNGRQAGWRALPAATWLVVVWWAIGGLALVAASVPVRACPVSQPECGVGTTALPLGPVAAVVVAGGAVVTGVWWRRRRNPTARAAPLPSAGKGAHQCGRRSLVAASVLGVVVGAHLLLFADVDDSRRCETPVRLNEWMGYALNCDSPLFMQMASFPDSVLQKDNVRQSRPVFVLISGITTAVVAPLADLTDTTSLYGLDHEAHLPLVLLDLAATSGAVAAAAWLLSRLGAPPAIAVAVGAILSVNAVTRQFTWSPHTQTMNLLAPMVSVLVVRRVLLHRTSVRDVARWGLLLGLGMLVYGATLIILAATALALLLDGIRPGWRHVLVLGTTATVPVAGWVAWCELATGSFRSAEAENYRQFAWLADAAREGLPELWEHGVSFWSLAAESLVQAGGVLIVAVGLLGVIAVGVGARLHADEAERATLVALVLTTASAVVFCWAIGYYVPRLAWTVLAPVLVLGGWFATRLAERWATSAVSLGCVAAAAGWVVHATFVAPPPGS